MQAKAYNSTRRIKKITKETKGIIIKAEYGNNGRNRLTLDLEIQSFDGWICTMIFEQKDNIKAIFDEFSSDYTIISNTKTLLHQKCYLAESEGTNMPSTIAKLPPSKFENWIPNNKYTQIGESIIN